MVLCENKQTQTLMSTLSQSELATLYRISQRTLNRWLKPFRQEIGKFGKVLTPKQLAIIYDKLGRPE
jgi:transposase-like protein